MPQKISTSRWNLGEASQQSIGDYDQPLYGTSCRFLRNFVVSDTGKILRRPGFEHHVDGLQDDVRILTFTLSDDTLLLIFYLTGDWPTQTLKYDYYRLTDVPGSVNKMFTLIDTHELVTSPATSSFKAEDFTEGRPKTVELTKLSYVQVDKHIYITHPNLEDPYDISFTYAAFNFTEENFSQGDRSYYFDIYWDDSVAEAEKFVKKVRTDMASGGGVADPTGDLGWMNYTGRIPDENEPNAGKNPEGQPQSFKYLSSVTFFLERLVWTSGPRVHGSGSGDPLSCGLQYSTSIPIDIDEDPYTIIASDPFMYRASSDLGYENFGWLASGPSLVGGANNGMWILSNAQAGGLDATKPLMYKSTSNGAHYVPGKIVSDALLYFQRPGNRMNEFIFTQASQNYEATNLSEYAEHIFYDAVPKEMVIQRSPFNIAWILREDGTLVTFTYDRKRDIYAWAQHPLTDDAKVLSINIYSDGVRDRIVAVTERENSSGTIRSIEMMDHYVPQDTSGVFVDNAELQTLEGPFKVIDIEEDNTDGHFIHFDYDGVDFDNGHIVSFEGASRTDDGVQPVDSTNKDYIYGQWIIADYDAVNHKFRIEDKSGERYKGIFELASDTITENAYIDRGEVMRVTTSPLSGDTRFSHLSGQVCNALLNGTPYGIYVSTDGATFYYSEQILLASEDSVNVETKEWDGDESALIELDVYWNTITIGLPYESIFSPLRLKKQINKGKINSIELEVFNSLGGIVGIGNVTIENKIEAIRTVELTYPIDYEEGKLYTGTLEPAIVGGFADDPLWFIRIDEAVPFNITNTIWTLGAN